MAGMFCSVESSVVWSPSFLNYGTRIYQIFRILHPLVFGDCPETMRKITGLRLPSFSSYESELVTHAFDFIGLNHYTSSYTSNRPNTIEEPLQDFTADLATLFRGLTFVDISIDESSFPRRKGRPSTSSIKKYTIRF